MNEKADEFVSHSAKMRVMVLIFCGSQLIVRRGEAEAGERRVRDTAQRVSEIASELLVMFADVLDPTEKTRTVLFFTEVTDRLLWMQHWLEHDEPIVRWAAPLAMSFGPEGMEIAIVLKKRKKT